jgi:hypothetical protein
MSKLLKALGLSLALALGGIALVSVPVEAVTGSGCKVMGSTIYYSDASLSTIVGECETTCLGCACSGQITAYYTTRHYIIECAAP